MILLVVTNHSDCDCRNIRITGEQHVRLVRFMLVVVMLVTRMWIAILTFKNGASYI